MNDEALRWKKLGSESGPDIPLFRIRIDTMEHPTGSAEFRRLVLESADWINVVAMTAEAKVVMVEQFRFGIGELTIEPVAGIVDPGEEPLEAAKRELMEEAGFGKGEWRYLGAVQANPAYHNNLCHHWLVEGVERVQAPSLDDGEAIRVHLMTVDDIKAAIASGRIKHPLALSALSRVFPLWDFPFVP